MRLESISDDLLLRLDAVPDPTGVIDELVGIVTRNIEKSNQVLVEVIAENEQLRRDVEQLRAQQEAPDA